MSVKRPPKRKIPVPQPKPDVQKEVLLDNRKPGYIVLLIVGLVLLTAGTVIALSGTMPGWEQKVFAIINSVSAPSWITEQLAKPISNAVWGMAILVVILLAVPRFRMRAWQYAVAGGSAYVLAYIVERLVSRGRPADMPYDLVLRAVQDGPGFPSTHVAVLSALGLTIWPYVAWPWRVCIVLFILVEMWARVFLGVHAPLDVLGGLAIGMTVVGLIHLMPAKFLKFFKVTA